MSNNNNQSNSSKYNFRFGVLVLMIVAAAATRLLPHYPNFTAVGGMALFGAAYFSKKYWAYIVPFAALWISDLFLNNFVYSMGEGFTLFSKWSIGTYLAFGLIIFMGSKFLKKITIPNVIGTTVGASLLFFLVTNFGVWAMDPGFIYPDGSVGLLACYTAGLPYFWNTLAGDLVFVGIMFGGFELIKTFYPSLSISKA